MENVNNIAKHCHSLQHLLMAVDYIRPNEECFSLWTEQQLPFLRTLSLYGSKNYCSNVLLNELIILQQNRPNLLIVWPEEDMHYPLEKKFAYESS